jgi:hypothetical protein
MILRSKVVSLLSEVPGSKLQLFKFREMFEKRYHASIGVSDLYKMKEVVTISEEPTGRMVQLNGTAAMYAQGGGVNFSSGHLNQSGGYGRDQFSSNGGGGAPQMRRAIGFLDNGGSESGLRSAGRAYFVL